MERNITRNVLWFLVNFQEWVSVKDVMSYVMEQKEEIKGTEKLQKTRYVIKVQSNGVYFSLDKNASYGSYFEFPPASLVEVKDKGFKVFGIGKRELNTEEKKVIANEPKDEEQQRIDMLTDGSIMYHRLKRYYMESGYNYLFGASGYEKGLYFNSSKNIIMDKSIKGELELEYEFIN